MLLYYNSSKSKFIYSFLEYIHELKIFFSSAVHGKVFLGFYLQKLMKKISHKHKCGKKVLHLNTSVKLSLYIIVSWLFQIICKPYYVDFNAVWA